MTDAARLEVVAAPRRWSLYYGWVQVLIASLAMIATLPGRTHGLALVTEPLLQDLHFDRVTFANINLAATILGAGFGIVAGWAIDRWGTRKTCVLTGFALAVSVFGLAWSKGIFTTLAALTFIRGFGQSALSVVSLAIVGKWFVRRLGMAMALFAVLITMGFIATVLGMGAAVQDAAKPLADNPLVYSHPAGWRSVWNSLGWWLLLGFVPLSWLLVRDTPESCGIAPDLPVDSATAVIETEYTFTQAIRTPAFWIFAVTTALFNLIWSGVTLFNESILAERGFAPKSAVQCLATVTAGGMLANLLAGGLSRRRWHGYLLGCGMGTLAIALGCFPWLKTASHLQMYAVAVGLAGGIVTVVFFAVWGQFFGRAQLGRIQGLAQVLATLASAAGPLILAGSQSQLKSYSPAMLAFAAAAAILAVACVIVPLPKAGP